MASYKILIVLKERDGLICNICKNSLKKEWEEYIQWWNDGHTGRYGKRTNINLDVDHILPRSKGGGAMNIDNIDNLALTHISCNSDKGNNTPYKP